MDKFKIVYRQVVVWLKKHWPLVAGSSAFIILLIMFLPVFRSSWLYYPESLRAKIALRKLAESTEKMYYCRDDCQAKRLTYQKVIGEALNSQKEKLLPDLEMVLLDKNVLPENKTLLINLWQNAQLPLTENLKKISADNNQDFNLRSQLIQAWPELNNNSFVSELIGQFKIAKNDEARLTALSLLMDNNNPLVIKTIWQIILGDYSNEIKSRAFFLLANLNDKDNVYWPENIDNLRAILESDSFPSRLKDQAILVLGDYYNLYPVETESLLVDIVNQPQLFDNYQRSFAIDILNNNRTLKITNLNLSQADWDAYYNN